MDFFQIKDKILSAHFRCGRHTLCRVAVKDANDALSDASYAALYKEAMDIINNLFKASNRPKTSEIIRDVLKVSLILPVKTRWNSLFDSVEHIISFELKLINTLMLALDLSQFTQREYDFSNEYLQVMPPIASAIDNLQSTFSYYAIFLPTLHNIKYVFDDLKKKKLKYCQCLLESVQRGFCKRFSKFFDVNDDQYEAATIAAVTHPYFKIRFLHKQYQTKKNIDDIRELLISKPMELRKDVHVHEHHDEHEGHVSNDAVKLNGNFFHRI